MSTAFQPDAFQSNAFQIAGGEAGAGIEVPDVIGQTQANGTSALEGAGFVVEVREERSTRERGTITRQEPVGGSFALSGSTVIIWVSLGAAEAGRRRERYIARYKGEEYEFASYEALEEFVQQAQKEEKKKPKRARKPIRIELTPDFVEEVREYRPAITPTKYVTLPPSEALKQVRQIEQLLKRYDDDDEDEEIILWLM